MDNAPQAPKKSVNEWLLQLSDEQLQVLAWWLDRKMENPDQPWDGAKRTCSWMGDVEVPHKIVRPEEK